MRLFTRAGLLNVCKAKQIEERCQFYRILIVCLCVCACVRMCACVFSLALSLSLFLALFFSLSLAYTPWQHERFESYRLSKFEYRATRLLLSAARSWMVSILGGAMPANPKPLHPLDP